MEPSALWAQVQTISGHVPREARTAQLLGAVDPAQTLTLSIGLPLRQKPQLDRLIQSLYDRHSSQYRHFLKPDEFTQRFGPSEGDYQAVLAFAASHNLKVIQTHSNRLLVTVQGSVGDIQSAFHVNLNRYQRAEGGEFYAPDQEPSVDLTTSLSHIAGLDNARLPKPSIRVRTLSEEAGKRTASGTGQGDTYFGDDFRNTYLSCLSSSTNGAGQTVALVEFDRYYSSDPTTYAANAGFPTPNLTNIGVDSFSTSGNPVDLADNQEVALDIEMVLCMANSAQINVYEQSPSGSADDILNKIATDDTANQISCSWTGFSDSNITSDFAEYAAQGQAFFQAAGDDGAYVPSDPVQGVPGPMDATTYLTVAGGTQLTTTGSGGNLGGYSSETTWNSSPGPSATKTPAPNDVGGGGICNGSDSSTPVAIPTYQVPFTGANSTSSTYRNLPDVAMVAIDIELIAHTSHNHSATLSSGGTSAAAPLWAGMCALINQTAASEGAGPAGQLNPYLYNLASNATTYANDFHDIADGSSNNYWGTVPSQFEAGTGFDLTTGLGSPRCELVADIAGLAPTWSPTPTPTMTPTSTATPTFTWTTTSTWTATATWTGTATATSSSTNTPLSTATATLTGTFTSSPTGTVETSTSTATPTWTGTFTSTSTASATLTASSTASATNTASSTSTSTSSSTASPTRTFTLTASTTNTPVNTFTATVTSTWSPTLTSTTSSTATFSSTPVSTSTITPTPTATASLSNLGQPVLAPVPVPRGGHLCLYPDKPTLSSVWDVYDLMGESVVHLSFNDGGNDCWNTQGVPPGIYAVRLKLNYMDGTQGTTWQKVLLSR